MEAEDAGAEQKAESPVLKRAERAFGPVIAGLILDFVDLATFGPVGLIAGWLVGFAAGYWICSLYRLKTGYRITGALLAAVYCMIPMTEVFPAATILGAFVRFFEQAPRDKGEDRKGVNRDEE